MLLILVKSVRRQQQSVNFSVFVTVTVRTKVLPVTLHSYSSCNNMSSTSSGVFPYPPPEDDTELTDRIQKLATYVARNGKEFEAKVKEKEQSNPQFSFLADTSCEGYLYYQWHLFCLTHQYTPEQIEGMSSKHKSKLLGLLPKGVMELSTQDSTQLLTMLQSSNGSKDTIKTARKWIVDRCQCIVNIGVIIRKYVISVAARSQQRSSSSSSSLGTTTDADGVGGSIQADNSFSQILFTIYILNDLFYNTRLIKVGPFYSKLLHTEITVDATSILYENLPLVLRTAYDRATEDSQRERIVKLVELWKNKCFITAERASVLLNSLTHPFLPPEPPLVPLSNHYIDPADIAPSNAVVKPTPPPIAPPMMLPPHMDNTNIHHHPPPSDHQFTMNNPAMMMMPMFPPPFFPIPPPLLPNAGFVPGVVYPTMAPLMPTIAQPSPIVMMDLGKIPVGNMANIVKAAKKAGHQPYATIDVMMYASHAAPYVEPGRLEAKLSEFYKHADLLLKKLASGTSVAHDEAVATVSSVKLRQVEPHSIGHSNEEEVWEKYVASATASSVFTEDDDKYRGGGGGNVDRERDNNVSIYGRYNKFARLDGTADGRVFLSEQHQQHQQQSSADREIAEDNVGHKLLRGLGWQQGSGLGTEGHTGIVEPIRSEGSKLSKDRTGLGLATAAAASSSGGSSREDGGVDVSSYRSQLSSQYHSSRTSDRDRR